MQQIMTNGNPSKLFIPYLPQFRATCQKVRLSVKKRIDSKVPEKSTQEIGSHNIVEISTEGEVQTVIPADSLSDETRMLESLAGCLTELCASDFY